MGLMQVTQALWEQGKAAELAETDWLVQFGGWRCGCGCVWGGGEGGIPCSQMKGGRATKLRNMTRTGPTRSAAPTFTGAHVPHPPKISWSPHCIPYILLYPSKSRKCRISYCAQRDCSRKDQFPVPPPFALSFHGILKGHNLFRFPVRKEESVEVDRDLCSRRGRDRPRRRALQICHPPVILFPSGLAGSGPDLT